MVTPRSVGYWLPLTACALLSGCDSGSSRSSATVVTKLRAQNDYFRCDQYPGPGHYVERCAVRFKLNTTNAGPWTRLGCFGELKFTQVQDDGRVVALAHGFYEGASQGEHGHLKYPAEFELTSFVYFPKAYNALDPSLDWFECQVHEFEGSAG